MLGQLLTQARRRAGLSQEELARRAHTSRPTLSAYENGRKSPTLDTAARLLEAAGQELTTRPRIRFLVYPAATRRPISVPSSLPQLPADRALRRVTLPLHLEWSQPGRSHNLAERGERARVYEAVLREGQPEDVLAYIDGTLLVDLWDELVLPRTIRAAWARVIDGQRA
jgi:transcriptional regulator with XRE-family HTH domain